MPTVPLSRPSAITHVAPASRSARASATHSSGASTRLGSFAPTSATTRTDRLALVISSRVRAGPRRSRPSLTSTKGNPQPAAHSMHASARSWSAAISSRVPPVQAATWCRRSSASLASRPGSRYALPHPSFHRSRNVAVGREQRLDLLDRRAAVDRRRDAGGAGLGRAGLEIEERGTRHFSYRKRSPTIVQPWRTTAEQDGSRLDALVTPCGPAPAGAPSSTSASSATCSAPPTGCADPATTGRSSTPTAPRSSCVARPSCPPSWSGIPSAPASRRSSPTSTTSPPWGRCRSRSSTRSWVTRPRAGPRSRGCATPRPCTTSPWWAGTSPSTPSGERCRRSPSGAAPALPVGHGGPLRTPPRPPGVPRGHDAGGLPVLPLLRRARRPARR